jgi:hypothetical protein
MSKMTCEMTALVSGACAGIVSPASADGIAVRCDAEEIYWCGDLV